MRLRRRSLNQGQDVPRYINVSASGALLTLFHGRVLGVYELQPDKTGVNKTDPVWKGVKFYLFRFTNSGKWGFGPRIDSNIYLRVLSWSSSSSPLDSSLSWKYHKDGWFDAENFSVSDLYGRFS